MVIKLMTKKISEDVANVLGNASIEGEKLYLSGDQLDRKLYLAVDKCLKAIGGKWNRKEKAHVFKECPLGIIENILLTGEYTDKKQEYQFFETPEVVAKRLIDLADIQTGESVCEPSAGRGAIAKFLPSNVHCIELEESNFQDLTRQGFQVTNMNFLEADREFDIFVANPPFTRQQDIDHVTHMIKLAKRRVVSVMSASIMFRTDKKTLEFRKLLESCKAHMIEELPEKSFAGSGTNVRACIVYVEK